MKNKIILSLLSVILTSCGSGSNLPDPPKPPSLEPKAVIYLEGTPEWHTLSDVKRDIGSKAKLVGKTLDLQGCSLDGRKIKRPKNKQDESSIALKVYIDGFKITNGIIKDFPGGVWVKADNVSIDRCIIVGFGEDAVSTDMDNADSFSLTRCDIYAGKPSNGYDKLAQLNAADNAVIHGNRFYGGITSIRIQKKATKHKSVKAYLTDNLFDTAQTAINVDGPTTVYHRGNTFRNILTAWVKGSKVKVVEK